MQQRIKLLISWLVSEGFAKNQEDLGRSIGINSKSYLSQLISGKKNNEELVNKLIDIDKRISKTWLLTGEGSMLNNNTSSVVQNNYQGNNVNGGSSVIEEKSDKEYLEIIKKQSEQLSKSQQQIDRLLTLLENK